MYVRAWASPGGEGKGKEEQKKGGEIWDYDETFLNACTRFLGSKGGSCYCFFKPTKSRP